MNCSVYIIGAGSDGVMHAYPDDYAVHDVFERFTPFLKEDSLFAIHRNGSLFYHIWYRKTSDGYFGICVLLNGMWFSQTDILIGMFESAFSLAAVDGKLLKVDNDGHIRTTASAFAHNKADINKIDLYIKERISSHSKYCVDIPPQNASVDPHSIQYLQHGASPHLFGRALETYRSVYATYGNVNALLQCIEDMAKERDEYKNKYKQLVKQCKSIKNNNRKVTRIEPPPPKPKIPPYVLPVIVAAVVLVVAVVCKLTYAPHPSASGGEYPSDQVYALYKEMVDAVPQRLERGDTLGARDFLGSIAAYDERYGAIDPRFCEYDRLNKMVSK